MLQVQFVVQFYLKELSEWLCSKSDLFQHFNEENVTLHSGKNVDTDTE
jgi:hypothetical protein